MPHFTQKKVFSYDFSFKVLKIDEITNEVRLVQTNDFDSIKFEEYENQCEVCGRVFTQSSELNVHRAEKHSTECPFPFECWLCRKT